MLVGKELINTHQYNTIIVPAQLHALTHNDNLLKRVLDLFQRAFLLFLLLLVRQPVGTSN